MTALATVEEQQRLLERDRLKAERRELRRSERIAHIKSLYEKVKETAARQVYLKRYVFLPDEQLVAKGLNAQQIAVVRQWEQPKRLTAFAVESSAKLIEAETRAQADSKKTTINVQNMVVLPEKRPDATEPVVIDVKVDE